MMMRSLLGFKRYLVMVLILVMSTMLIVPSLALASEEPSKEITLDASNQAASLEGAAFAVDNFTRKNSGINPQVLEDGTEIGFRYSMAGENALALLVLEDEILIYISEEVSNSLALDFLSNKTLQDQLIVMLTALDKANAKGGKTLEQQDKPYSFTSSSTIERGDYLIEFGVEVVDEVKGAFYYTVISANPNASTQVSERELRELTSYMLTGNLIASEEAVIETAPEGWDAFVAFLTDMDYRPFWVSLKTSLTALVFVFILGLAAARLTLKVSPRIKDVLDAIFTIPMVLPPTVIGFLLLVAFGNSTAFGQWLIEHGIKLVFSWPAAVIAATVVAFPLLYRTVRGAFEAQDQDMMDAARTLGWSESRIFFKLMMPLAWPSIAAGTVLAFARAMGEFGATMFVAGNYAGVTQTMPVAIYFEWMGGNTEVATFWVIVVILISFVVILFINLYARHTQKYRLKSGVTEKKRSSKGKKNHKNAGAEEAEHEHRS